MFIQIERIKINRSCTSADYGQISWGQTDQSVFGGGNGVQIIDCRNGFGFSCRNGNAVDGLSDFKKILKVEEATIVRPGGVTHAMCGQGAPVLSKSVKKQ